MLYKALLRPLLFLLSPERAHEFTFACLKLMRGFPAKCIRLVFRKRSPKLERDLFGLHFPNPVGLAGGLDKNSELYNELLAFGFGFVEVGSLTPKPQNGQSKPRLFRLKKDRAIINRMGINNKGVSHAISELLERRPEGIIVANIAKNSDTEADQAPEDYRKAFAMLYELADMFVVNVSCPNVEGLTDLQNISYLSDIMDEILDMRTYMDEYRPVLVKLSPDISFQQLDEIVKYCLQAGIDGVVAANTSRTREGLATREKKVKKIGSGGLSGAPIYKKNLEMVRHIHEFSGGRLPIIGCGGIMSGAQAKEMLDAGASLIEIYTGFIYEGPSVVKKILKYLEKNL